MIALSPRDIGVAIATALAGSFVLHLIDRAALGIECARIACQ
jgi:hypothetical protein